MNLPQHRERRMFPLTMHLLNTDGTQLGVVQALIVDGNCWAEDRGLKTHHGHVGFLLSQIVLYSLNKVGCPCSRV
ncbi:ENHANCED DISEASE RESISTANCE 2-like protein [Drosera capensis]